MTKEIFTKQLNQILIDYEGIKSKAKYDDFSDIQAGSVEDLTALLTKSKAAVARISGTHSEYYKDVISAIESRNHEGTQLRMVAGCIAALKNDLENDYLKSLHDLVQTEVFTDYLEMAGYLLAEGFKDPSAVIIGSTLEIQLRDLCKAHSVATEFLNNNGKTIAKKTDVINADLAKAGIYSSAYQKQVTAWIDIRNSAAHGHYGKYSNEEVKLMLQGIRQFILSTT